MLQQRGGQKEATTSADSEFSYEDVCKPGNTLLWDLVQEDKVVSLLCFPMRMFVSLVIPCYGILSRKTKW